MDGAGHECAWTTTVGRVRLLTAQPRCVRDHQAKVTRFSPDARVARLAVTTEQVDEYDLPTRPTRASNSRAAGFQGGSVEVDAIPAAKLRAPVEEAITRHIDEHERAVTLAIGAEEPGWRRFSTGDRAPALPTRRVGRRGEPAPALPAFRHPEDWRLAVGEPSEYDGRRAVQVVTDAGADHHDRRWP